MAVNAVDLKSVAKAFRSRDYSFPKALFSDSAIHPSLLTTFGTLAPAIWYSCGFSGEQMTMPSAAEFEQVGPKKQVEFRIYLW